MLPVYFLKALNFPQKALYCSGFIYYHGHHNLNLLNNDGREFSIKGCISKCCSAKWLVRTPTTAQPRSVGTDRRQERHPIVIGFEIFWTSFT